MHLQTLLAFIFIRANSKGHVPWRRRQRNTRAVEVDRARMVILLMQTENEVFVLQNSRRHRRRNRSRKKCRRRPSVTERRKPFMPEQEIAIQLAEGYFLIDAQPRLQSFVGQEFTRRLTEFIGERREIFFTNR